jgi:TRAP-type mannitol/chloroaromatic compound transport system substrate-binding protein
VEFAAEALPGDPPGCLRVCQCQHAGEIRCADGAVLKRFSDEILEGAYQAALQTYAELSAKNPAFKKIYDDQLAFKKDAYLWDQVAEFTYDYFMIRQQSAGKL